jgi:hypothetical protein
LQKFCDPVNSRVAQVPSGIVFDDRAILLAWSEGRAGAGERLAKRAWLVLQDLARQDPYALGAVASGTGRVREWLQRYRAMGALGLLDAPRSGRPKVDEAEISRLAAIASTPGGRPVVSQYSAQLSKAHREALWRAMRKAGATLSRNTRLARYPLSAPGELVGIVGVLSLPGLLVLAFAEHSEAARLPASGSWLTLLPKAVPSGTDSDDASRFVRAVRASGRAFGPGGRTLSEARVRDEIAPTFATEVGNSLRRLRSPWHLMVFVSERPGGVPLSLLPVLRADLPPHQHGESVASPKRHLGVVSVHPYRTREGVLNRAMDLRSQSAAGGRVQAALATALARETFFCWFR